MLKIVGELELIPVIAKGVAFLFCFLEFAERFVLAWRRVRDVLAIEMFGPAAIADSGVSFADIGWQIVADCARVASIISKPWRFGEGPVCLGCGCIGRMVQNLLGRFDAAGDVHLLLIKLTRQ